MQKKIIAGITIILILICAYWYGGSSESSHGWTIRDTNKAASEQIVSGAGLGTGDVVDRKAGSEITDIDTGAGSVINENVETWIGTEADISIATPASEAPVSEDNNNKL